MFVVAFFWRKVQQKKKEKGKDVSIEWQDNPSCKRRDGERENVQPLLWHIDRLFLN